MTQKPKIFIATPMYGGNCSGVFTLGVAGLTKAVAEMGWDYELGFIFNESLITRARDNLVHQFLKSDCTHLMFIDADIGFNPNDIISMVQADESVVCGLYPAKSLDWDRVRNAIKAGVPNEALGVQSCCFVFQTEKPEDGYVSFGERSLKPVTHAGTGFMLIKREVFEKLKETTPTYTNNSPQYWKEPTYAFFQLSVDDVSNELLSEDYHFCKLWLKAGGSIYIAQWILLKHQGTYWFG